VNCPSSPSNTYDWDKPVYHIIVYRVYAPDGGKAVFIGWKV